MRVPRIWPRANPDLQTPHQTSNHKFDPNAWRTPAPALAHVKLGNAGGLTGIVAANGMMIDPVRQHDGRRIHRETGRIRMQAPYRWVRWTGRNRIRMALNGHYMVVTLVINDGEPLRIRG
jgi:ribonuclease J